MTSDLTIIAVFAPKDALSVVFSVSGNKKVRFSKGNLWYGKVGDADEFSKWVNSRLVYPKTAKENGIQGRVLLQITINEDGSVSTVKVLRGVDPSLDKEAVRAVSNSPKWEPGRHRGRAVIVTYTFPVAFMLR